MRHADYIRTFDLLTDEEIRMFLERWPDWELPRGCRDRVRRMEAGRALIRRIVRLEGVGDVSRVEVVKLRTAQAGGVGFEKAVA